MFLLFELTGLVRTNCCFLDAYYLQRCWTLYNYCLDEFVWDCDFDRVAIQIRRN